jgi:tyrosinase
VDEVLDSPNFADFSNRLEGLLHNAVHVWAGGVMTQIPLAAYDPVFWAHHTMVDRLWYLWQLSHPDTLPDTSLIDQALAPFPMTVRQTLDVNGLGYDYAVTASTSTPVQ